MGPLTPSGVEPTIYLSMSVISHEHAFTSSDEFTETTRRAERGANAVLREVQ